MDSLGFRATFYDVIGYMIPGSLAILVGWANVFVWGDVVLAKKAMKTVVENPWFSLITIAAVGYICGHALNALSSCIIEWPIRKLWWKKWTDWTSRLDKEKLACVNVIAQNIFSMPAKQLSAFDIRIRLESQLPGPAITGLCFLSYYGMSRNLVALSLLATPVSITIGGWWGVTSLVVACLFFYQYKRSVVNYYDFLGSSLLLAGNKKCTVTNKR